MRRLTVVCGAAAALVLGAVPAAAGPVSGTTTLQGTATSGGEVVVGVTLKGVYPVVAYDYLLENQLLVQGEVHRAVRLGGDLPLLGPWFAAAGGGSYSEETVDLDVVPAGAVCRVTVNRAPRRSRGRPASSYSVG